MASRHSSVRFEHADVSVNTYSGPGPVARIPALDPDWVAPRNVAQLFGQVMAMPHETRPNLLLTGPSGTGKTLAVRQMAARLGAPLVTVSCSSDTRVFGLFGSKGISNGTTHFDNGPVLDAYQQGCWLLLDEVSAASPGVLHALHGVLSQEPTYTRDDGEVIRRGEGFMVCASSNVVCAEPSERRRYAGNHTMNAGTLSRFQIRIEMLPPTTAEIRQLLHRWCRQSQRPEPSRDVNGIATWFRKLAEPPPGTGEARPLDLRELRTLWALYHTPLADYDGATRYRNVHELAEVTVLPTLTPGVHRDTARELLEALVPQQ